MLNLVTKMSTILITGGLGFIGSHVARAFLGKGYNVVLLDITTDKKLIRDIEDKVIVVRGDIANKEQLSKILKRYKPDTVIHYAALLSSAAESNPELGYSVNFSGLWNVYDSSRVADVNAIIFASSIAAYGPGVPEIVSEDTFTIPQTLYGISKQLGEMLGLWFYKKYGIQFAAPRYASVVGPGRRNGGASAYSTLLIQKPAQGDPYIVNVPKDAKIPLVYIKDVADVTIKVCENIKTLKSRIYNISSFHENPTALEIAKTVKKFIPEAKITFKPDPTITEIVKSWPRNVSLERIKSEVNWVPKYGSLDTLVNDFIKEVRNHPDMYYI